MAITIKRADDAIVGHDNFAVLEPNHLSAPRNGGVYGQLPADKSIEVLEQGTFVKYDYAAGKCDFDGEGPWMLVFNEEKLYDERKQMHCDFALQKSNFYDGIMTPRVFKPVAGDLFTTNCVKDGEYNVGDKLVPGAKGILEAGTAESATLICKVVAEATLPEGQKAVKLQVIKAE